MSEPKPYPPILKQTNFLIGMISLVALLLGGTLLVLMIWDDTVLNSDWGIPLVGNCAVLIGCGLVIIAMNRICGSSRSTIAKAINALVFVGIMACLIMSSLVIWDVTGTDEALRAIGTIVVFTIVAFIFVPIANALQHSKD